MTDVTALEAQLAALWAHYNGGGTQAEMNDLREQIRALTIEIEHERDRPKFKLPREGYPEE